MIHYMIRWLSMAWGAFLPHLNLWTTPPPAVKRSTAVLDSGTEGCLRQPEVTRSAYK